MMTMAPTPQQMDPKFYELAFQLAGAMASLVANPQILAEAERARAKERQLTDEQVQQYQEALDTLTQAGDISARAAAQAQRNIDDKAANAAEAARLAEAFANHDRSIEALNAQQKKTNEREGKVLERELAAAAEESRLVTLGAQLQQQDTRLKNLASELKKREDALMGFANMLAPKDGANGSATA